jgi:5-hydroxyisourate hydrolase
MSTCSTHVLDAALGIPADALTVTLYDPQGRLMTTGATDADGRAAFDLELGAGTYSVIFDSGPYFAAADRDTFYPEVGVTFTVDPAQAHYHLALLLSAYSYTTYRGS